MRMFVLLTTQFHYMDTFQRIIKLLCNNDCRGGVPLLREGACSRQNTVCRRTFVRRTVLVSWAHVSDDRHLKLGRGASINCNCNRQNTVWMVGGACNRQNTVYRRTSVRRTVVVSWAHCTPHTILSQMTDIGSRCMVGDLLVHGACHQSHNSSAVITGQLC